jgi:hypothetical protein
LPDGLPTVRLDALGGADASIIVPHECFESVEFVELHVEADRVLDEDLCVEWRHDDLMFVGPDLSREDYGCPRDFDGGRRDGVLVRAGDDPPSGGTPLTCTLLPSPTFVELVADEAYELGTPSRAQLVPCEVFVDGERHSCSEESCVATVAFEAPEAAAGSSGTTASPASSRRGGLGAGGAHPALDTLRRTRDEQMATSRAGRYYRDLYTAFSPELRDLLVRTPSLFVDIHEAYPPWIDALGALVDGEGDGVVLTPDMVRDMLAILDRFEGRASPALREVFRRERGRLRLEETAGLPIGGAVELLEQRGGPPECVTSDTSLCLQGGRFRVEVTWTDFQGASGSGQAVPLSGESGYFWFFDEANVELVLKVLDARGINDRYWVFYGALSDVEYTVLVTDTATGALRAYRNPRGVFASVGDTAAFAPDGAPREESEPEGDGEQSSFLSRLTEAASETMRGAWRRVRGLVSSGASVASLGKPLAVGTGARWVEAVAGSCLAGAIALCLAGDRFRVEVEWRDFAGGSGFGIAAPLTADTGTFWFFEAANTELIVKVLDARAINGHFWVYYGALSNVEYTLRITDTATGVQRTYRNPSGEFASLGDVEAF